jgi:hypothetical protein
VPAGPGSSAARFINKTKLTTRTMKEDFLFIMKSPSVENRLKNIEFLAVITILYAAMAVWMLPTAGSIFLMFAFMFVFLNGMFLFLYLKKETVAEQYYRFARLMLHVGALALVLWVVRIAIYFAIA